MTPLEAVALGALQGLTEFLPVSSSGHLVLAQALLGVRVPGVVFEVAVHVGTLGAVLWVYRGRVAELARGVARGDRESVLYLLMLGLATVPAAAAGLVARTGVEASFELPVVAAALLLLTGGMVWSVRRTAPGATDERPGPVQALWAGAAQALALLPGISRSGATLAAGVWRGVEEVRMAEFSFLMSVPAVGGAALLQAGELGTASAEIGVASLGVGFAAALLSGVAAIRLFVEALRRRVFHRFAHYCWAVGGLYLVAALLVPELRG